MSFSISQVTFTQRFGTPLSGSRTAAADVTPSAAASAVALPLQLRQSLYFRSTELAVKWMAAVTSRELL